MKIFRIIRQGFAALLLLAVSQSIEALDLPTKIINGKEYYYYKVKKGDTVFSLCRTLGVSREEIASANPVKGGALKANTELLFPVGTELQTFEHKVEKGETLFGISHKYNVPVEELVDLNPNCRGVIKSGQIIKIPVKTNSEPKAETPSKTIGEKISDKAEAIADNTKEMAKKAADKTVDIAEKTTQAVGGAVSNAGKEISNAFGKDKKGKEPKADTPEGELNKENPQEETEGETEEENVSAESEQSEECKIAVLLPFMLDDETLSRQTKLYTDFFKGLLIAADTLSYGSTDINILAYDTKNSEEEIRLIMQEPEMETADVIIAPENASHMKLISSMAPEGSYVFNVFNVRNQDYETDGDMVQLNLPASNMFDQATDALLELFPDYKPVILNNLKGKNEKQDFVRQLEEKYNGLGLQTVRYDYEGHINQDELSAFVDSINTSGKVIFLPTSGSLSEFNIISRPIKNLRSKAINPSDYAVWGYPDWTAFRSDAEENLHALNATVYSRFFYNPNSYKTEGIASSFRKWYGENMIEVIPCQAILGYDVGIYAIENMRKHKGVFDPEGSPYEGVQSSFLLIQPEENGQTSRGYVNDAIYIIRYDEFGGSITRLR